MNAQEFAKTKLGQDLTSAYGWDTNDFRKLEGFVERQRQAADSSKNQSPSARGRKAFEVKASLLMDFGCPREVIGQLEIADRNPRDFRAPGVEKKWKDLIFAANCMG